jgi:hypothetical protein
MCLLPVAGNASAGNKGEAIGVELPFPLASSVPPDARKERRRAFTPRFGVCCMSFPNFPFERG